MSKAWVHGFHYTDGHKVKSLPTDHPCVGLCPEEGWLALGVEWSHSNGNGGGDGGVGAEEKEAHENGTADDKGDDVAVTAGHPLATAWMTTPEMRRRVACHFAAISRHLFERRRIHNAFVQIHHGDLTDIDGTSEGWSHACDNLQTYLFPIAPNASDHSEDGSGMVKKHPFEPDWSRPEAHASINRQIFEVFKGGHSCNLREHRATCPGDAVDVHVEDGGDVDDAPASPVAVDYNAAMILSVSNGDVAFVTRIKKETFVILPSTDAAGASRINFLLCSGFAGVDNGARSKTSFHLPPTDAFPFYRFKCKTPDKGELEHIPHFPQVARASGTVTANRSRQPRLDHVIVHRTHCVWFLP